MQSSRQAFLAELTKLTLENGNSAAHKAVALQKRLQEIKKELADFKIVGKEINKQMGTEKLPLAFDPFGDNISNDAWSRLHCKIKSLCTYSEKKLSGVGEPYMGLYKDLPIVKALKQILAEDDMEMNDEAFYIKLGQITILFLHYKADRDANALVGVQIATICHQFYGINLLHFKHENVTDPIALKLIAMIDWLSQNDVDGNPIVRLKHFSFLINKFQYVSCIADHLKPVFLGHSQNLALILNQSSQIENLLTIIQYLSAANILTQDNIDLVMERYGKGCLDDLAAKFSKYEIAEVKEKGEQLFNIIKHAPYSLVNVCLMAIKNKNIKIQNDGLTEELQKRLSGLVDIKVHGDVNEHVFPEFKP